MTQVYQPVSDRLRTSQSQFTRFRLTLFSLLCLTSFSISILPRAASALPRFALKGGEEWCGGCHVNPTGGGMRTEGGDNFAMSKLPMWKRETKFSANISDGIRIGTDLRSQYLYFADHSTGSISRFDSLSGGNITSPVDTTLKLKGAFSMALPVYLSATLSPAISAYMRFDVLNKGAWEGYATIQFVHPSGDIWESGSVVSHAYLKIGAFAPTFGIRFDDHTVYTRGGNATLSGYGPAGLFWQPNYKDEGAELGFYLFDHLMLTADFLNGNEMDPTEDFKVDPFGPHALAFRASFAYPIIEHELTFDIGGSAYLHTQTDLPTADQRNDSSARTELYAVHGGIHAGPISVLAEADFGSFIYHPLSGQFTDKANAMAIEASGDITDGLTALVRFDKYNDKNNDVILTDVKNRFMIGLQWFPIRFLEFRPEFRIAKVTAPLPNDPTTREDHTETTMLLQTHIFF